MKKKSAVTSDERTMKNTGTAAVVTLALLWVALIVIGLIKGFKYGAESTTEEILILLGSLFVFLVLNHRKEDVDLPKTFFGRALPSGLDKKSKGERLKAYVYDSLGNAALLTAVNVGLNRLNPNFYYTTIPLESPWQQILLNIAADMAVMFAVFMIVNYFWGEHNIKKYNEMIENDE